MRGDPIPLGTKARTLARLTGRIRTAGILPLDFVDHATWQASRRDALRRLYAHPWADGALIVRSSALGEDSATASGAGQYLTLTRVHGAHELEVAVEKVFASYGDPRPGDEVLIQPELLDVVRSGVACTHETTSGAPYTVISWSEEADTDVVTGGREGDVRTWYGAAYSGATGPGPVPEVLALLAELRGLTGHRRLDVEFAVATGGRLVLLQVRPLACVSDAVPEPAHDALLHRVERAVEAVTAAPGAGLGERTAYGIMPDWNPAEMIGLRPRPLALSLYRRLITDQVWARARHRYGYRDLRGTPLLASFCGLPYIDVRASVSSLIPRGVPDGLATRLTEAWVARLLERPELHDKLESRIVVSSLGLRAPGRLAGLRGFAPEEVRLLETVLRRHTDELLKSPLWTDELRRVAGLRSGGPAGLLARLGHCAEHGTLPFAGLARAAFIGNELLDDLVAEGVFTEDEKARFIGGLGLVTGKLNRDFATLAPTDFLARYGHLRPGTYDIRSLRYDEDPAHYFDWSARRAEEPPATFTPSRAQLGRIGALLDRAGLTAGPRRLLEFVGSGIRGRELAKFEFSRVLSDVLVDLRRLGERHGFSADDLSFAEIGVLGELTGDAGRDRAALAAAIEQGRLRYEVTRRVTLPPLLGGPADVRSFTLSSAQPSYVTQARVRAKVADVDAGDRPDGAIALVSSADPGYDWLFARGIAGLVTAYGGVNSHMAIRAIELGVPAVIGVGEQLFRRWSAATALDLDAANRHVAVIP
ncbi:Pyruvate phosphate dikinase, PEP/pyruvate binding domain [Amycolatopsis pretoriensis]|uniref:Pyruvate phosphate dikinase, PEP/pyruvate binding domain n=1 Tax=Amycolatopsis pretoriensis TaxID=218821 RepID=A0A1H5RHX4_9PSEU|nr:PEP/pyruvate-binding domain-containing protein [Amycolatopsis pretoriensis]SEF37298.1 Pyruvate phosphate dikinase, PEP/pyruvate binding domain [Amycolatopsis pretoriensis]